MRIHRQQRDSMQRRQRQTFEDEMVVRLRSGFADFAEGHDEQALRNLIQLGMQRAAGYGICRALDVSRYIESMLIAGAAFDEQPWAQRVLTAIGATGTSKMDAIDRQHPRRVFAIASER